MRWWCPRYQNIALQQRAQCAQGPFKPSYLRKDDNSGLFVAMLADRLLIENLLHIVLFSTDSGTNA
jgi:hypothetical protein